MLRLALSTLAGRKAGAAGAFVAVALASILTGSMGILLQSSLQAPLAVERLQQATVVVQGPTTIAAGHGEGTYDVPLLERSTIDLSTVARIQGMTGVAGVVADRSVYATLLNERGRPYNGVNGEATIGHGWESSQLTPYAIVAGHPPLRAADVVIDQTAASNLHTHPGGHVRVLTTKGSMSFIVSGIAATPRGTKLPAQGALFFRSSVAARLSSAPSRVDLLGVVARPGVSSDQLAAAVTAKLGDSRLRVLTGAKRGDAESPDDAFAREDVVAGLTVFAVIAAFVALFVVSSTFALSVQQRHRELALFRAIGSTPRQVRRLVAGEALLIALAAVLVALPLGVVAAYVERGLFSRAGMVPTGLHLVVGWLPMVAALVSAVVTTQVAAFASARRAARIRPTDALRESAGHGRGVSRVRVLIGLAALGAGIAMLAAAAKGSGLLESEAPAAGLALTLAVALLGPVLAWPFAFIGGWLPAATGSAQGVLAWANGRANLRRVASVATPVMLAVSVVGTMYVAKSLLRQETHGQTERRTTAAYVLRAEGAAGLPLSVELAAAGLRGVTGVTGTVATSVIVGPSGGGLISAQARAIDPGSPGAGLDLAVIDGSLNDVRGDGVAVSVQSAQDWHWSVGDRVRIRLGDGSPVSVRVVAKYERPLGFGEVLLPRTLIVAHVTNVLDDAVFVSAGHGSNTQVARELETLRASYPTLDIIARDAYVSEVDAAGKKQALEVYVLLGLIVVFCALGLVNALTMAVSARTREFATLLLIGATRRQVRSMVRIETTITLAFGLAAGSAVAIPGLALLEHSLNGSWVPAVPLWPALALLGSYATLGIAATIVPVRSALRAAGADR